MLADLPEHAEGGSASDKTATLSQLKDSLLKLCLSFASAIQMNIMKIKAFKASELA